MHRVNEWALFAQKQLVALKWGKVRPATTTSFGHIFAIDGFSKNHKNKNTGASQDEVVRLEKFTQGLEKESDT